jgi:hypothetical protein
MRSDAVSECNEPLALGGRSRWVIENSDVDGSLVILKPLLVEKTFSNWTLSGSDFAE